MRISIYQSELSNILGKVSRAVSSKSSLPVLGNILLTAGDGELSVAATNFEISIIATGPAKVDEEGAITLPAKQLAEFVNALPDERIGIETNERTVSAAFKCFGYSANMKGIDAAEFPIIPTEIEGATPIALDASALATMFDAVTKAASTDDSRPTLTGVEFSAEGGSLHLAATDGYRLATWRTSDPFSESSFIVPAKSLAELARIAPKSGEVSLAFDDTRMLATCDGVTLNSQLIAARFPDYRAIIPKERNTTVTVNAGALRKATQMASLFARENAGIVRYAITGEGMVVSATGESGGSETAVGVEVDGDDIEIALNGKYVLDVLDGITGNVVLEFTQATRPVKVTAEEFPGLEWVVMPMHKAK